jgi:orotidine-5'-phosphate decarboxylase
MPTLSTPNSIAECIIVPLDVPTEAAAIALIDHLSEVQFWKVGLELFVSCGPRILEHLKHRHKKIFLDLKFHDIPNTVAGACRAAAQFGVDILNVHATAGSIALKAAKEATLEGASLAGVTPPQLIAVTILTSLSAKQLAFELKIPLELPDYALQLALLTQEAGLDGVVCSPQEAAQLRETCGADFLLVCPGVRPQSASLGDQQRSLTPADAIAAGASYLVIGRPITAAADPVQAFQDICAEISDRST